VVLLTLVGLAAALTGCGADDSDVAESDPFDAAALSGTATTVDGDVFDLGTLADADLVVWFWAPW
jgi:hypothetical protein